MSYRAAVLTISDSGSRGERRDSSGPAVRAMLEERGWEVCYRSILPDDFGIISAELIKCADELAVNLVITTGGTGFSPRDVTPEATKAVTERDCPGIPEAMRAESMRITPRGCLSRSAAGIRGRTLIVNLPGSEKAAGENLGAVLGAVEHGVEMLLSEGSAGCGERSFKPEAPSMDAWLREAKAQSGAEYCGSYLFHRGVVRRTSRAQVREGEPSGPVAAMEFSRDSEKLSAALDRARELEGVYYVRAWLNSGRLEVGEDLMLVLVGGDTRPRVMAALEALVEDIKTNCVSEKEIFF